MQYKLSHRRTLMLLRIAVAPPTHPSPPLPPYTADTNKQYEEHNCNDNNRSTHSNPHYRPSGKWSGCFISGTRSPRISSQRIGSHVIGSRGIGGCSRGSNRISSHCNGSVLCVCVCVCVCVCGCECVCVHVCLCV